MHSVIWFRNEDSSIDEYNYASEGLNSVGICRGLYQCKLELICVHVLPFNST